MTKSEKIVLSTAYFPPIDYFVFLANADRVLIEQHENYQKQSYRTRCNILSANGILSLTLPVSRKITHQLPINEIEISYSSSWINQHKRALVSAYNSSPFFKYYADDIFPILDSGERSLIRLNTSLLNTLCSLIGIDTEIGFTDKYISEETTLTDLGTLDLRTTIHPKKESPLKTLLTKNPYYQLFDNRDFVANLSILDLLFNEGPETISYLVRI